MDKIRQENEYIRDIRINILPLYESEGKEAIGVSLKKVKGLVNGTTSHIAKNTYATDQDRLDIFESLFHAVHVNQLKPSTIIKDMEYRESLKKLQSHEKTHLIVYYWMSKVVKGMVKNPENFQTYKTVIDYAAKIASQSILEAIGVAYQNTEVLEKIFPALVINRYIKSFDFPTVPVAAKQQIAQFFKEIQWTFPPIISSPMPQPSVAIKSCKTEGRKPNPKKFPTEVDDFDKQEINTIEREIDELSRDVKMKSTLVMLAEDRYAFVKRLQVDYLKQSHVQNYLTPEAINERVATFIKENREGHENQTSIQKQIAKIISYYKAENPKNLIFLPDIMARLISLTTPNKIANSLIGSITLAEIKTNLFLLYFRVVKEKLKELNKK